MDYTERLQSESLRVQQSAAIFVGNEGADGYRHIPALLKACRRIDTDRPVLCWDAVVMLSSGAQSMGAIINAVGCSLEIDLHRDVLDFLRHLTDVRNPEVAAGAIYGLEKLGIPPVEVRDHLCDLITSERRPVDHPVVTARALAFRVLSRLDRVTAKDFVNSAACSEFLRCVDYWIEATPLERRDQTTERLAAESLWLRS